MNDRIPAALGTVLCAVLCAAAWTDAGAKRVYQYRDEKGVLHFTDKKPPDGTSGVTEALVKVDARPLVDMVSTDIQGGGRRLTFRNNISGPVEIELVFKTADNVASEPPLPLRTVLPPNRETPVAVVNSVDPAQKAGFQVEYRAVPGDPSTSPETGFVYGLPFPIGSKYQLHQAFGGQYSHSDPQSYYAIDLAVEEGTPVLAARAGTVMQVDRDFYGSGLDKEKFGTRANQIRVVHDDGTMALYAHLQLESAVVAPGQRVRQGQQIAKSGNTGFSSGPHLHFAVQHNSGMDLQSIPFRMGGVELPDVRAPRRGPSLRPVPDAPAEEVGRTPPEEQPNR